jgi:hypothetical protein
MTPRAAGIVWRGPASCGTACSSLYAQSTAASSSRAATIRRFTGPIAPTSHTVRAGPASAPADPPAAMNPKRRFPCSLLKRSAMKDQKTDTAKRLNTLIQTKKTRATSSFS